MKVNQITAKGYAGEEEKHLYKLALTGLFAAMSYVVFTFLQIKITLPGGDATSIHLGNAVCVLGALILGGFYGGLGGAIGMITGLVAHRLGRINEISDKKKVLRYVLAAAVCGLLFNVVFDPMVGYFYKLLILGKPAAQLVLAWNITSTSINAVTSTFVSVAIYMPLRSALIRAGLFDRLR